jgi:hypothetical protein
MSKWILSAVVFGGVLYLIPTASFATPEYSRRSDKECSYCHPAKGYSLTDAGKYYKDHKTLKGYQPPPGEKKPDANQKASH